MRRCIGFVLLTAALLGILVQAQVSAAGLAAPQKRYYGKYVGLYPDALFKGEPGLKPRLRKLLGTNYTTFMSRLQTQMPIEDYDQALIARGCMAHQCGVEVAILVIGTNGKLHCAIKSEKFGGRVRTFSEDRAHIPAALNYAMQQP